jgi:hypothetical protein
LNKIDTPQPIYLFFILLFSIQIYYFFIDFFISGLFSYYGFTFEISVILIGILFIHGLILLTLYQLYIGIIHRKAWARKFTMFYLIWASLWALWGIIVGNNIIIHLTVLILYLLMIIYLTTPSVQLYFNKIYRYGKYILYTKLVTLRSGLRLPIYFFSSKPPKSGHPTALPEGYIVKENEKSHMPYLKKSKATSHQKKTEKSTKKQHNESIDTIYIVNDRHDNNHDHAWAIKSHTKVYSHARTKQKAIQLARNLARKHNARVLVQNTNGKFSYGFTPRPQKK